MRPFKATALRQCALAHAELIAAAEHASCTQIFSCSPVSRPPLYLSVVQIPKAVPMDSPFLFEVGFVSYHMEQLRDASLQSPSSESQTLIVSIPSWEQCSTSSYVATHQ